MTVNLSRYQVKLAQGAEEVAAAQRLRYRVFVEEMGADATSDQRGARREWDAFDGWFDHLLLVDLASAARDPLDRVVGAYRLLRDDVARSGPGFYGASEYDLGPILRDGRRSLELGRSCVAKEHRGGPAMHLLWNGLAEYVLARRIEILFGVASFPGADPARYAEALAYLHRRHLAPEDLRVRARADAFVPMDAPGVREIDEREARKAIPPLISAYLRLGGWVGEGAFVDHRFNTVDVCVVMDTTRMTERYRAFYERGRAA
ncbi:GNAT family N-acetyltransferase [Amaricoccus solimangrovi]|uniref:L-ornithine N(alpha)-acyltransferase n=1 Tax=Amaricoccus solimangrovi TaxID=2589815 RepID=A0A501WMN7_9RHOB|nr:GNAT family N-acyltransferase [Amaricoccus solimangrovi]TPE48547.1 GNAT family N-acetyltransferase [Amaricoccus solimangrovi]